MIKRHLGHITIYAVHWCHMISAQVYLCMTMNAWSHWLLWPQHVVCRRFESAQQEQSEPSPVVGHYPGKTLTKSPAWLEVQLVFYCRLSVDNDLPFFLQIGHLLTFLGMPLNLKCRGKNCIIIERIIGRICLPAFSQCFSILKHVGGKLFLYVWQELQLHRVHQPAR